MVLLRFAGVPINSGRFRFLLQRFCKPNLECTTRDFTKTRLGPNHGFWTYRIYLSLRMVPTKRFQLRRLADNWQNFLRNLHLSLVYSEATDVFDPSTNVFKRLQRCKSRVSFPSDRSTKRIFRLQMAYVSAVFGMSVIFGFLLTVAIEIPISSICKTVLKRRSTIESKHEIQLNGTTRNCQY